MNDDWVVPGPPIRYECHTFEEMVERYFALVIGNEPDPSFRGILFFAWKDSPMVHLTDRAMVYALKHIPDLQWAWAWVNEDARLMSYAHQDGRRHSCGLVIEGGFVVKVIQIKDYRKLTDGIQKWQSGICAGEAFPPNYGAPYQFRIHEMFGYQKPDYELNTMSQWINMWNVLWHERKDFPTQSALVLFYDKETQDKLKIKDWWIKLRGLDPARDYPAVNVDSDPTLRAWANSQDRWLPVVLAVRTGRVEHVARPTDLVSYGRQIGDWVAGMPANRAFHGYNGEAFRMRIKDAFANSKGDVVVDTLPGMIDLMFRIKEDGIKNPKSKALVLLATPNVSRDEVYKSFQWDLPEKFPDVDFPIIIGQESKDDPVYKVISASHRILPGILVCEGGLVKYVSSISMNDDYVKMIKDWKSGGDITEIFGFTNGGPWVSPISMHYGRPAAYEEVDNDYEFSLMMQRFKTYTSRWRETVAVALVWDTREEKAKKLAEAIPQFAKDYPTTGWGTADVSGEQYFRDWALTGGRKLPALFAISAGKVMGIGKVDNKDELKKYMDQWRKYEGDPYAIFYPQNGPDYIAPYPPHHTAHRLMGQHQAVTDIHDLRTFFHQIIHFQDITEQNESRAMICVYRENDLEIENLKTVYDRIPQMFPGVAYATACTSDHLGLAQVCADLFPTLPGIIVFREGKGWTAPTPRPHRLVDDLTRFIGPTRPEDIFVDAKPLDLKKNMARRGTL